jgi:hypothetical protein
MVTNQFLFISPGSDCGRREVKKESSGKDGNRRRIEISWYLWRPRAAKKLLPDDQHD